VWFFLFLFCFGDADVFIPEGRSEVLIGCGGKLVYGLRVKSKLRLELNPGERLQKSWYEEENQTKVNNCNLIIHYNVHTLSIF